MPYLEDISYSRDETIAAIRDYYEFLISMFLDDDAIEEPPEEGWPNITDDSVQRLGKSAKVADLLRHLPYLRILGDGLPPQGAPRTSFANWRESLSPHLGQPIDYEALRTMSEPVEDEHQIPSHVIGLTMGAQGTLFMLLDIDIGVIYWYECPGDIKDWHAGMIEDDPSNYAPEEELEWRKESGAWPVREFFKMLKEHFQNLHFVPTGPSGMGPVYGPNEYGSGKRKRDSIKETFRNHDWPLNDRFRKQECVAALQTLHETEVSKLPR